MRIENDDDDDVSDAATCNKWKIRNVYLNAYESQITALYGNSGSGKSATLALLAGIHPATEGTAFVNGYDIRTSIRSYYYDSSTRTVGVKCRVKCGIEMNLKEFAPIWVCASKKMSSSTR